MNTKSAPSQHLNFRMMDFRARANLLRSKIDKAEAENRISNEKAAELRQMVRESLR